MNTNSSPIVKKSKKVRKDKSVLIMIVVVIIVAAIVSAPLIWAIRLNFTYHHYIDDLRDDFIKGERFDKIEVNYNGEEIHLDREHASDIFAIISVAGMGRTCDPLDIPQYDGVFINLGHGTSLFIAHTIMKIEYGEEVPGIYVEYTYKNGKKYCYETDEIYFYNIENVLEDAF